jgi:pyruvate formate lyase activating enzyme
VAQACHAVGVKTVAVTAGYISPQPRVEFFRHMDAANVDLKGFSEEFYHRLCTASLAAVLDTLKYIKHETDCWLEITTLLIPGENDSEQELHTLSEWVFDQLGPDVPLHFTAFHPDYKMRDKSHTPHATLIKAYEIARASGLSHVYVGNVRDRVRASTYCANCGEWLIGRDGYVITDYKLDGDGVCRNCRTHLAGVFDNAPGHWGARRVPVRMAS